MLYLPYTKYDNKDVYRKLKKFASTSISAAAQAKFTVLNPIQVWCHLNQQSWHSYTWSPTASTSLWASWAP